MRGWVRSLSGGYREPVGVLRWRADETQHDLWTMVGVWKICYRQVRYWTSDGSADGLLMPATVHADTSDKRMRSESCSTTVPAT